MRPKLGPLRSGRARNQARARTDEARVSCCPTAASEGSRDFLCTLRCVVADATDGD